MYLCWDRRTKGRLDVAIGERGDFWNVANDEKGIAKLVERMKELQPELIVLESTEGKEVPAMTELYASQVPVALVNPGRVRQFAGSWVCWPRPINWMPVCWPVLLKRSNRR